MAQVADYNIANASGASVRSDINSVLEAIKTCNSGGNDPSNPEPFMLYVDTADSNKLKIRNSANNDFTEIGLVNSPNLGLLPVTGGTMTGGLRVDTSSSPTTPGLSFGNDSDTGLYRKDANKLGIACGGSQIANFEAAGLLINATGSATRGLFFNENDNTHHVAIRAPSSIPTSYSLQLPSAVVNGGFLQTDGSGNLSFSVIEGVPTGSVFCRAASVVPAGYLECNGAAVSRSTYAGLFGIIGVQYGAGNGSTTFNLPDLRGEFIRGFDHGRGVDNNRSMASSQGAANHAHTHSVSGTTSTKSLTGNVSKISETFEVSGTTAGVFSKQSASGQRTPISSDFSGAGQFSIDVSHNHTYSATTNSVGSEARPRNIAMMYIIKI